MKKQLWIFGLLFGLLLSGFLWPVSVHQSVNDKVIRPSIPWGWKTIHFLSRHDQTKQLTGQMIDPKNSETENVIAIFRWMQENMAQGIPEGMPMMNDHLLHHALRRYGTEDPLAELLTALCADAGIQTHWDRVRLKPHGRVCTMVLLEILDPPFQADPARSFLPLTSPGRLEDLASLRKAVRFETKKLNQPAVRGVPYDQIPLKLSPADTTGGMNRGFPQMPVQRVTAWVQVRSR